MPFQPLPVEREFTQEMFGDGSDGDLEVTGTHTLPSKPGNAPYYFRSVTVRSGGLLTCKPWDRDSGGVVRLRVTGTVLVEDGGCITAANCGIRLATDNPPPSRPEPSGAPAAGAGGDPPTALTVGRAGCPAFRSGGVVDVVAKVIVLQRGSKVCADAHEGRTGRITTGWKVGSLDYGRSGFVTSDDETQNPYKVQWDDDNSTSGWLYPREICSGGGAGGGTVMLRAGLLQLQGGAAAISVAGAAPCAHETTAGGPGTVSFLADTIEGGAQVRPSDARVVCQGWQWASVHFLLWHRFGRESVEQHLARLTDNELGRLVRPARMGWARVVQPCGCGASPRHEALQDVMGELDSLVEVMVPMAAELAAGATTEQRTLAAVDAALAKFRADLGSLLRASADELFLDDGARQQVDKQESVMLAIFEATVAAQRAKTEELTARSGSVAALRDLALALRAAKRTAWDQWQTLSGQPHALAAFQPGHLEQLLVSLGLCDWVAPLAAAGMRPEDLPKRSGGVLRRIVADTPHAAFGDVRSFCLAVRQLDEGCGVPAAFGTQGFTDDRAQPVERWSVDAVAAQFQEDLAAEEQLATVAVAQCRTHRLSGLVLLSLDGDDIGDQLSLPSVDAVLGFERVVRAVQDRDAARADAATRLPTAGAALATHVELSDAVINTLVGGGAPAQFPYSFVQRCTGNFSEDHVIGRGAFGCVYRAVDPASGLRFAVKLLDVGGLAVPLPRHRAAAEQGMQRELKVLCSVRHPNIIRLLGYGTVTSGAGAGGAGVAPFLVYELGAFGSVADNLVGERAAAFDWRTRTRVLVGLASCLNYLHRSHDPPIYHRDVKSANVVLVRGHVPKLIDCGLARLLTEDEATQRDRGGKTAFTMGGTAGSVVGTPGFMCPRFLTTGKFGDRSEVFSFGVTMLEVLVGKRNEDVPDGLFNHYMEDEVDEFSAATLDARAGEWPAELAAKLVAVAESCLDTYRRRPKTMQAVLRQLKPLEQQFCQLTVEDVQERVAVVQAEHQDLVEAWRQRNAAEETAMEATQAAAQRTCCVCYDDFDVAEGVDCAAGGGGGDDEGGDAGGGGGGGGGGGDAAAERGAASAAGGGGATKQAQRHFLCDDCLAGHVLAESEKDLHDLARRGAEVFCVAAGGGGDESCSCKVPFAARDIAAHCPPAVFGAYLAAQAKLKEQAIVRDMDAVFEARLAAERKRIEAMTSDQQQVERARQHVVEQLLTLKCPRCQAAFLDFTGCFALSCHLCDCRFCGYCLADSGVGAPGDKANHAHVASCEFNPPREDGTRRYFAEPGKEQSTFDTAQQMRRRRMVNEFLQSLSEGLRVKVVGACAQDLADLQIEVNV